MDHVLNEIALLRVVVDVHQDNAHRGKGKVIAHLFHVPVTIVIMDLEPIRQVAILNEVIQLRASQYLIRNLTHILQHTRMRHTEQRNQNTEQRSQKR